MGESLNASNQISVKEGVQKKRRKRSEVRKVTAPGAGDQLFNSKKSEKEKVKTLHQLVAYARKHRLASLKFGDIEFELTHLSYLTRDEQKAITSSASPSEHELREEEERLLYAATPY